MDSIKQLYNKAADHVRMNKNTAIFAAVFGAISTFQIAPAVLSNPQSNIIQETAFLATTGAAKTGLLYAGFLLGAAGYGAARRKGIIKGGENDQVWGSVSSSVGAMAMAYCTFGGVHTVASPLLAYEDTNPSQQQYATINEPQSTKAQDGRIVSYDAKANVLTIA